MLYAFERFLQRHGIEQYRCALYNLQSTDVWRDRMGSFREGIAAQLVEGETFADAVRMVV